jgi:hypothetical protein
MFLMLDKTHVLALIHFFDTFSKIFFSENIIFHNIIEILFLIVELMSLGRQFIVIDKNIKKNVENPVSGQEGGKKKAVFFGND